MKTLFLILISGLVLLRIVNPTRAVMYAQAMAAPFEVAVCYVKNWCLDWYAFFRYYGMPD